MEDLDTFSKAGSFFKDVFSTEEYCLDLCRILLKDKTLELEDVRNITSELDTRIKKDDVLVFKIKDEILMIILRMKQRTVNESILGKFIQYLGAVYGELYWEYRYNTHPIKICAPAFFVIYDGNNDSPLETELRSTSKSDGLFVQATAINLAQMHLLDDLHGNVLVQYALLLKLVKLYEMELGFPDGISEALVYCKEHGILMGYLTHNSNEALALLTEESVEE